MIKEKMKHIVLLVIALALIGVGYLNYDYDKTLEVAAMEQNTANQVDESTLGDAELVNADTAKEAAVVPNDDDTEQTAGSAEDYFSSTRLEREKMYSQMLETYQKMVDSTEITNDQKAIAIQEISNITTQKNAIMIAENLIKNKNFEDVVILVSNGTASIVVKSSSLNADQIAQVQNIVSRELGMKSENITISQK